MKKETTPNERRYARLKARVAKLGPVLQGNITERSISRPAPDAPGKEKTYGPYYQWTFKRQGKTVTVNLSASQAKVHQRAIDRNRELEATIAEMRTLSLAILETKTKGVKKRKSKQ